MLYPVYPKVFTEALCYSDKIAASIYEIKTDFESDNYVHLSGTPVVYHLS